MAKTRDYTVNGIIITDCQKASNDYNSQGIPSMTEKEVLSIKRQLDGKMPKELKELICMVKTTIGGTVKRIWAKNTQ